MPKPMSPASLDTLIRSTDTADARPLARHTSAAGLPLLPDNLPPDACATSVMAPPCAAAFTQGEHPENSSPSPDSSVASRPKLMTSADVAAFFGCTERTIRNWRKRGVLRARRVGGSVFFLEDEVVALLNDEADEEGENANG